MCYLCRFIHGYVYYFENDPLTFIAGIVLFIRDRFCIIKRNLFAAVAGLVLYVALLVYLIYINLEVVKTNPRSLT